MAVGTIEALTSSIVSTTGTNSATKKTSEIKSETKGTDKKTTFGEAAVFEKSTDSNSAKKTDTTDRSAIVEQLKADAETRQNQLLEIVRKTMQGQGKTLATADDMWKFLADGNFTVDAATKKQAQEDISENGYWGVNKTSDRILDFAKALTGNDSTKADKMLEAFKKGYEQATSAWGKDLPDISKQTYDAVVKKFEAWKNGTEDTSKSTEQSTENQIS
jgi:hypothetical protein